MSTKLSSPRTELAVLRAACSPKHNLSGLILKGIDESYFNSPEARAVLSLINDRVNELGKPPNYRAIIEDPSLERSAVDFFRNSQAIITDPREAKRALESLKEYRRRRALDAMANYLEDQLDNPKLDSRAVIQELNRRMTIAQQTKEADRFFTMGVDDNIDELVHDLVYTDRSQKIVPTGFKTYDRVNGGLLTGSLVTIGGTTGGGKSTLANQLAVNIASAGYSVNIVPLEMTASEMLARIMATVLGFDALRLVLQETTERERKMLVDRFYKWRKWIARKGGRYTIYKPESATMSEALMGCDSRPAKVNIIDYLGLLEGMDGDDQAKRMGSAARQAKIHADSRDCINVILVQLDDEGKVRYSRAVQEHANNSWTFVANDETREQGILNIDQPKARNQKAFRFSLRFRGDFMRVTDLPSGGLAVDEGQPQDSDEPQRIQIRKPRENLN